MCGLGRRCGGRENERDCKRTCDDPYGDPPNCMLSVQVILPRAALTYGLSSAFLVATTTASSKKFAIAAGGTEQPGQRRWGDIVGPGPSGPPNSAGSLRLHLWTSSHYEPSARLAKVSAPIALMKLPPRNQRWIATSIFRLFQAPSFASREYRLARCWPRRMPLHSRVSSSSVT